jgi:hypothetical protein
MWNPIILGIFMIRSGFSQTCGVKGTCPPPEHPTNKCASLAVDHRNCFEMETPHSGCCHYVANVFAGSGCFCDKIAVAMLGTTRWGQISAAEINNLMTKCGKTMPPCSGFARRTYNGGTCPVSDQELDLARFANAKKFTDILMSFAKQTTCFDYQGFRNDVARIFKPDAVAYAGQGLGIYAGIDHIAEYFSLLSPKVNKGFVSVDHSGSPQKVVHITMDGTNVTVGQYVTNKFAGGRYQRPETAVNDADYLETTFTFKGCEIQASAAYVPTVSTVAVGKPITGVAILANMMYKTVNMDFHSPASSPNLSLMGIVSICKQHTAFCTGSNSQFPSEAACLSYYRSIPRMSAKCGNAAILSGNSVTCRAKHQFMAQISPITHCPHLGFIILR